MLRDELGFHIPFVPWSAAKGMVIIVRILRRRIKQNRNCIVIEKNKKEE